MGIVGYPLCFVSAASPSIWHTLCIHPNHVLSITQPLKVKCAISVPLYYQKELWNEWLFSDRLAYHLSDKQIRHFRHFADCHKALLAQRPHSNGAELCWSMQWICIKNLGKSAWRNVSPLNEITYWKFKFLLKWLGFTHGFHQAMINVTAPIVHPLTIGWAYDAFVLQQSHFQGNQPTASFYCSFFVLLCSFFGLF